MSTKRISCLNRFCALRPGTSVFSFVPQDRIFDAGRETRAMRVAPDWGYLFGEMEKLGPVAILSRNKASTTVEWPRRMDFAAVGELGLADLVGNLDLDPAGIGSAMLVEQETDEERSAGIQFFDHQGEGFLKVILSHLSNQDAFVELVLTAAEQAPPLIAQQAAAAEFSTHSPNFPAEQDWRHAIGRPASTWIPGLDRILRRDALLLLDAPVIQLLPMQKLHGMMDRIGELGCILEISLFTAGARHRFTGELCRRNCCKCGYHGFMDTGEIHLAFKPRQALLRVNGSAIGRPVADALECYSDCGELCWRLRLPETEGAWSEILRPLS